MTGPQIQIVGYVYVTTEDGAKLLQELFSGGRGAGSVTIVERSIFRALREEVLVFPIHVVGESPEQRIVLPDLRAPESH